LELKEFDPFFFFLNRFITVIKSFAFEYSTACLSSSFQFKITFIMKFSLPIPAFVVLFTTQSVQAFSPHGGILVIRRGQQQQQLQPQQSKSTLMVMMAEPNEEVAALRAAAAKAREDADRLSRVRYVTLYHDAVQTLC
jgi:hypothetical protein